MFESGRALFDPTGDKTVGRGLALSIYGIWCFCGLFMDIFIIWKYGASRPVHLAIYAAVFFLSLVWLRTTLRSGPPKGGRFSLHSLIYLLLIFASNAFSSYRVTQ
jgi:hypothetical protein